MNSPCDDSLDIYRPEDHPHDLTQYRALALMKSRDVLILAKLVVFGIVSWLLPMRAWRAFARGLVSVKKEKEGTSLEKKIGCVLGERGSADLCRRANRERRALRVEFFLQIMRDYRVDRFRPEVELRGSEHIDTALAAGKGVLLWIGFFECVELISKLALYRAGYAAYHLTHPTHGLSQSRFGVRFLNPMAVRIENRYLKGRVFLNLTDSGAALAALRERLAANSVISILVNATARKVIEAPFFDGRVQIAAGPVKLALATGAPLLPVFLEYDEKGKFTVHVEPPISRKSSTTDDNLRTNSPQVIEMVQEYVARLEPYVLKNPGLWKGWFFQVRVDAEGLENAVRVVPGLDHVNQT
jgi:lauroyl/myristoyl acyltransferase